MRRLSIHIELAFGRDEPDTDRDSQLDAMVERAHPDDVSERAELDSRHPIGFRSNP